jgi:nucleoside-diphosphate-sugar epimerase
MLNDCQPCVNGSPYALRDYLYVDDLIELSIQAADCRVGGIFNVASGDPHGLQGVLKIIADILDKPLDTIYIGERKSDDFIINISKAVSVLGFRPRPLSEGLMLLCGFMQ